MSKVEYVIPQPPQEIFQNKDNSKQAIIDENRTHYLIERFDYTDGIKVYYKGCPYPRKGFPFIEAVSAVNIVKHVFIESIKTLGMWQFSISWFLALWTSSGGKPVNHHGDNIIDYGTKRESVIEKLLGSFNRISYGIIAPYVMKPEYMTPLASELQALIYAFMVRIKINPSISKQFATIFGTLIEYDNAYRYRLQDIFSETTKEKISKKPYRELRRIVKIYASREKDMGVSRKFTTIYRLGSLLLLFPMVKLAIRKAVLHSDFERLQMDEADRYWCKTRNDYNFEGLSYAERMKDYVPIPKVEIIT